MSPTCSTKPAALRVLEDPPQLLQPTLGEPACDDPPGLEGCLGVPEVLSQPQTAFPPFGTRHPPVGVSGCSSATSRTPLPARDLPGALRARRQLFERPAPTPPSVPGTRGYTQVGSTCVLPELVTERTTVLERLLKGRYRLDALVGQVALV